jgi:DNA repair protein RecN (Recombination protein N)
VLTGETGAGKSILLDALGLVLGARADLGLIRAGESVASVVASFDGAHLAPGIAATLGEAGVEIEPGEPLILRRQLKQDGGSRAYINDQPVSVALLREIAPFLVEIHGQHDDRGLVNPRGHRALLDRYVGHGVGVDAGAVEAAWRRWRKAEEALSTARARLAKASEDRDLLLAHVAELATLAPEEGEEDELAAARADMQKGERLSGDLGELSHLFTGSDSALAQLRAAARRLDRIAASMPCWARRWSHSTAR